MAERLGVPAAQLVRWVQNGAIDRDSFIGSPWAADRIRFTEAQADELRAHFPTTLEG